MSRFFALFFLFPLFTYAGDSVPDDFVEFYKGFRQYIVSEDYKGMLNDVCFPFKAVDLSEGVPENKAVRIIRSKDKFLKFQLPLVFLYNGPEVEDFTRNENGGISPVIYYENIREVFLDNEDPRNFKKVPQQEMIISVDSGRVIINSFYFAKVNGHWCWNEANYLRDKSDKW